MKRPPPDDPRAPRTRLDPPSSAPSIETDGEESQPTEMGLEKLMRPESAAKAGPFERLEVGASSLQTQPVAAGRSARRPLYRADPDRVLRVLSANQFDDPFLAFRELYANALDAVRGRRDPHIDLKVTTERVVLEDNGTGLDEPGIEALTTLGLSTRRGRDAIGRFGIGFASVFDPQLGVARVEFVAARYGLPEGVRIRFVPDVSGGVPIELR